MQLAALVLDHATADATADAVAALCAGTRTPERIWVLDNGSGDAERLRARLADRATLLRSPDNLGFSGGVNRLLGPALEAGADVILLVNSDALVAPGCVATLVEVLASHPGIGIVAPALRAPDGRVESEGIAISTATGRIHHPARGRAWAGGALATTPAVSGCVMAIRREVLDRVGWLRAGFFYALEDVELCLRAARAGFGVACARQTFATHAGALTIGPRSPDRLYYAMRNHLSLLPALGGPPSLAPLRATSAVALGLLFAALRSDAPRAAGLLAVAEGVRDHLRGREGPRRP